MTSPIFVSRSPRRGAIISHITSVVGDNTNNGEDTNGGEGRAWKTLGTLLFLLFIAHVSLAQFPLELRVNVARPYPLRLSDYSDFESRIFIDVTNNTSSTFKIILSGSLTNDERGIKIETDPNNLPTNCIIIEPGVNQLSGMDLEELFDPNHLRVSGVSLDQIRGDQALPEGTYTLCLRAFDCEIPGKALSDQPELLMGCTDFEVTFANPPDIVFPECGAFISEDLTDLTMQWLFAPPDMGYEGVLFKVRMVEIDPPGRNPNDVMNSATSPFLFERDDIDDQAFNLALAEEFLEPGKSYAFQVIAYDPENEVQFRNNGASVVCHFNYVESGSTGFQFEPEYPKDGDYIPFDFFPFVIKFTPYSDGYRVFEGDFTLSEENDGVMGNVDERRSRNRWPDGPHDTQRRLLFSDLTEEQSQHLPVYKNNQAEAHDFRRGKRYTWAFDGTMELLDGEVLDGAVSPVSFHVGMSPPTLQQPASGSTIPPGNFKLQWLSADAPEKLIPEFAVTQVSGRDSLIYMFNGAIDERWVLEVSRSESFERILFSKNDRINGLELTTDPSAISDALYKTIVFDTTLTAEGIYYWRVKWLSDPNDLASEPQSISPVWHFKIGTGSGEEVASGACVSGCEAPEITNRTAIASLSAGKMLKIGLFDMEVTEVTSSSVDKFTGVGEVNVSFLNLKVLVEFENIKFNSDDQIFSGTVEAKEEQEFPYTSTVNDGVTALGMNESTADELEEYLSIGERLVSGFTGNRAIGMPIGIDKEIEGKQFTIAVLEMSFTPERAALQAVANIDLNLFDETHFFSAGIGDFCFSPDGFGREGVAFIPTDHTFAIRNGSQFSFKGLESAEDMNDSTSYSYFNWDCNGFKCLNLAAEHKFARDVMVPDTPDGTPGEGQVVARMNFKACRGTNLMARIDMDPFQFPVNALKGYAFVVEEAWLDCSDIENPPEFEANLPDNYISPTLESEEARLRNTWTGFWLKRLHMRTPGYVSNANRERISAGISNLIKDNSGFTASFSVDNLITWEEDGHVEGFSFSIDRFFVDIVQSEFTSAGLAGKFGVPITGEREYLEYTAAVDQSSGETAFKFVVSPKEDLSFEAWIADVNIEPTSTFELRLGSDNFIGVDLNGSLSISSENQPNDGESARNDALNLNMPGITVEHLRFNSDAGFDDRDFRYSLASPQKSMSGFPIGLDTLELGLNGFNPTLTIVPTLTLAGDNSGFSAKAEIVLEAAIVTKSSGKKRLKLTGVDLDAIHLEVETSAITLEGYLEFYKEASAKGVRGALNVELPAGIGARFKAEFGTYKSRPDASFNTPDYFSYWYVEGMVTFGSSGLSFFPPSLLLYGIGGGVYHHMRPGSSLPSVDRIMADGDADGANASSGVDYRPHYDTRLGLKFMALFGSDGQGKAYNFDVTLEANFSHSGGLTYMGFKGNVRVFSEGVPSTANTPIMGYVEVNYRKPAGGQKTVDGQIFITVNIYDILVGTGEIENVPEGYKGRTDQAFVMADFYAGPDQWYYHMGSPDNRAGLSLQIPGLKKSLMKLESYLMIGHGIPSTLPRPSEKFLEIFLGTNNERFRASNSDKLSELRDGSLARSPLSEVTYNQARGFAFGSSFETGLSLNPRPFYLDIDMAMGFDVNVTKDPGRVCKESGLAPGVNDWYATGQFYMALQGDFGIRVRLFRRRRELSIFKMGAGMLLRGGLPNPAWAEGRARIRYAVLNGLIKGSFSFKVNIGNKCTPQSGSPLDDIQVIQDLQPSGSNDVSVFTNMSAAFAIPVNEVLEIPQEDDIDGEPLPPQRIMPFIESWTLKEVSSGFEVSCRDWTFAEENTVADMETAVVLKGRTQYTQRITLKAREYFPNGTEVLIDWEEYKDANFTTADAPDHLTDDNIVFTYPFKNQNYFLKGETQGDMGYVQLGKADDNNFDTYNSEFNEHVYIARFFKLGSETTIDVPIQLNNGRTTVAYDVSQLENDTHYTVQLLKIETEREADLIGASGIGDVTVSDVVRDATEKRFEQRYENLIAGSVGTVQVRKKALPGPTVRNPREHVLYYYHFKTDQHNTLNQKVSGLQPGKSYSRFLNIESFTLEFDEQTNFDWLDGRGFTDPSGTRIFDELVDIQFKQLGGEFSNNSYPVNYYYRNKIQTNINAPTANIIAIINRHYLPDMTMPYYYSYDNYVKFSSDSPFRGPLSEMELDRAHNPPEETSSSSRPIASADSGLGIPLPGIGLPEGIELPVVKVKHQLSTPGIVNFSRFKSSLGGYLSEELGGRSIFMSPSNPRYHNPNYYYNQYKNRYGEDFVVRGRTVSHYLARFHQQQYYDLIGILFRSNEQMLYPNTSFDPNRHSFIMQYRYPAPNRIPTMVDGTHRRITFTHTGN